jgi:hypothetical protein
MLMVLSPSLSGRCWWIHLGGAGDLVEPTIMSFHWLGLTNTYRATTRSEVKAAIGQPSALPANNGCGPGGKPGKERTA